MKLFGWFKDKNENKVLLVKITNDALPFGSPLMETGAKPAQPEPRINFEFSLKLAAIIVGLLNGLLAIMGYINFTGRLDSFGISSNEIDLGLPSLLFQGYRSGVLAAYQYAVDHFGGMVAVLVVPAVVFYLILSRLLKPRRWQNNFVICLLLALGLMVVSIAPHGGLRQGQESAYSAFKKQNEVDGRYRITGLSTETTMVTKEGPTITGETIFASTLYTYILQGPKLYKIANRDNHIVSVSNISANLRLKESQPPTEATLQIPQKQSAQTPDTPATQSTPGPHHR
jgi:hypothetical protein